MAIVIVCQEWRQYIKGATYTITIYTDYKNLIYFMIMKELNQCQVH